MCQALCLGLGGSKTSGLGLRPSRQVMPDGGERQQHRLCGVHVLGLRHEAPEAPCFCHRLWKAGPNPLVQLSRKELDMQF